MKAKSTIFLFFTFIGLVFCKLSAQEYNAHDVEKVKAFLRQNDNFKDTYLSPSDTLNWNINNDWLDLHEESSPYGSDIYTSFGTLGIEWIIADNEKLMKSINIEQPSGGDPKYFFSGILDLNDCSHIEIIEMRSHGIERLEAKDCANLKRIDMQNGKLAEIDIKNSTNIQELNLCRNNLNFEKLPIPSNLPSSIQTYEYAPQNNLFIKPNYVVNTTIDISESGGEGFYWIDEQGALLKEGTDYSIENGVTTFLKENTERIHCEIKNPDFPGLTISTTGTYITTKLIEKYNDNDKNKLASFLNLESPSSEYWMWDDGYIWKIFDDEFYLYKITLPYYTRYRDVIDFSNCKYLKEFKIAPAWYDFVCHALNLSGCSDLETLILEGVRMSELNIDGCTNIKKLNLADNFFTFAKLPDPKNHQNLGDFSYSPQCQIEISKEFKEQIDLSHIGGINFKWSNLIEGTDYTVSEGITTFLKKPTTSSGKTICTITNPKYPDLKLTTTELIVNTTGQQSIESSTFDSEIQAYSIAKGEIILITPSKAQYIVYNMMGKTVAEGETADKTQESIQVMQNGIYLLKIEAESGSTIRKVIVK